jgi:hypothetical protein
MKLYRIEIYSKALDKWMSLVSFSCMRKTFADGAWSMLKAHYGENKEYRLVIDKTGPVEIVDTWNSPTVKVNCN